MHADSDSAGAGRRSRMETPAAPNEVKRGSVAKGEILRHNTERAEVVGPQELGLVTETRPATLERSV